MYISKAYLQSEENQKSIIFMLFSALCIFCFAYASYFSAPLVCIVPCIMVLAAVLVYNYTIAFYSFFLVVPFSIEYNFTSSLGTDLPSEPIMWIMLGISLLLFFRHWDRIKGEKYINVITGLVLVHFSWIGVTTILSTQSSLSIKVLIAKLWYIVPFYFLSIHILKNETRVFTMIKSCVYTLSLAIVIVLFRHAQLDFSFDLVNQACSPLFRNHVNYACIIVVMIPYLWVLYKGNSSSTSVLLLGMAILYVIGIYFSYTRAAILALVLSVVFSFIVRFRLVRQTLLVVSFTSLIGITWLMYENNYLRYTPNFERTITHQRFDKLITATYKMEDVSTMERVYRWVAGLEMIKDKPIFGFGPGTFYANYKAYTVAAFKTYVSDNPDQSTVHCYPLLVFIEQGLVGFLIFVAMCFAALVYGEKRYHSMKDPTDKTIIMASMVSLIIVLLINLINDLIETDKVGPFFFLALAIIGGYKSDKNPT